jgi:hypothetical protein
VIVFLDTGVLGAIVNPNAKSQKVKNIKVWSARMEAAGHQLIVPAIADYELRREFIRDGKTASLAELDRFNTAVADRYLLLEDAALKIAAREWAKVRNMGRPTADPKELDGDAVLAGQVLDQNIDPMDYIVATDNLGHLTLFVNAAEWQTIAP